MCSGRTKWAARPKHDSGSPLTTPCFQPAHHPRAPAAPSGCVAASKLLRVINNGNTPEPSEVDAAAACFGCYKRTANRLEVRARAVLCTCAVLCGRGRLLTALWAVEA